MNKNINMVSKEYPCKCVCCGEGIINEMHDICLVCGWEDDEVQNYDVEFSGGANKKSLRIHRESFEQLRKKNKEYKWCNTWK